MFAFWWVKAHLNRQNMLISIQDIRDNIDETKEETAFIQNFEKPFLESDRAPYYLWHENGVLYDGERVVRLRNKANIPPENLNLPDEILAIQQQEEDLIKISSPEESRHFFINDKLSPLKDLGLIE